MTPRTAFARRPEHRSAEELRKAWVAFLDAAGGAARDAASVLELATLNGLAVSLKAETFPLGWAEARCVADGALGVARALAGCGFPAVREELRRVLEAQVTCLQAFLAADQSARAEVWKRQHPGDWE